jgi:hypothetical protein
MSAKSRGKWRKDFEERVANRLLIIRNGLDIDERARKCEDVHKRPFGGGEPGKETTPPDFKKPRAFDPDSAPPAGVASDSGQVLA